MIPFQCTKHSSVILYLVRRPCKKFNFNPLWFCQVFRWSQLQPSPSRQALLGLTCLKFLLRSRLPSCRNFQPSLHRFHPKSCLRSQQSVTRNPDMWPVCLSL
ncbi:hypothetical protein RvY_16813-2 [Ramazzottius varieornatus]|uniref:Uncharacterized protein n=1 Tax=Ramazzottius varieornatus TaxID=947166 RepID=A0A1D1W2E6_RAMVA|nr:hypothetical protein RvY_16813-2 [Ramazzottius varieornatus]